MCHLSLDSESALSDGFWSTDYYKSMASNLWLLREQNLYTDLVIECEDRIINVHRIIVAAGIDYFRQMLGSKMSESLNKVKLNCVTYEAIHQILSFVYCGQIHLDKDNIIEVTLAADFLLVDRVKAICESFLLANVDVDNCFIAKELSYNIVSGNLGNVVDKFVLNNFEHLCSNPDIGIYSFNDFQQLLRDDNLRVRHETQIFKAITHWIDYDYNARIGLLDLLITCVRFLFMPLKDVNSIAQHPYVAKSIRAIKLVNEVQDYFKQFIKDSADHLSTPFDNLHSTIRQSIETKTRPSDCRFLPLNRLSLTGTILALGGRHENLNPCNLIETYNLNEDKWQYKNELLPFAGRQVGLAVINSNVYLLGGYDSRNQPLPSGILNSQTGRYESIPQMPLARRSCAVTQVADKFVFVLGGTDVSKYAAFADVQIFDVEKQEWSFAAPMLTGRRNLASVTLGNHVYAIGGEESSCVSSMERYDVEKQKWEQLADMKFCRYNCGAVTLGKRIYVVGGFGWDSDKNQFVPLSSCEYYDVDAGTWHEVKPLQTCRGAASVVAVDGHIFAIGGFNGEYLSSVERYDPLLDCWVYCSPMQQGRSGSGCAYLKELFEFLFDLCLTFV
ncbi:Kelch-like protein 7 isoform X2 [Aphelenchoides bicaudatus]|nr:Kelch-like protein 7 isoform X2 [Aphelenchoides bicaudatus]